MCMNKNGIGFDKMDYVFSFVIRNYCRFLSFVSKTHFLNAIQIVFPALYKYEF